jgi:hypothetical protein
LHHLQADATEGVGLAARVIVHLATCPALGVNEVATPERTQQGLSTALRVPQGSLVRVLQRLCAGKIVAVERRFVLGPNRRMKVYRLTSLGDTAARSLFRKAAFRPPDRPPGGQ